MRYLAIDPGNTTGWALFAPTGDLISMGKGEADDVLDNWEEDDGGPLTLIIEIYRNRQGGKYTEINAWSDNKTSQVVGMWKRLARKKHWSVVEQEPSPCLSHGLRFLGMYQIYYGIKKKHVPDDVAALAHGTYYLRKKQIL